MAVKKTTTKKTVKQKLIEEKLPPLPEMKNFPTIKKGSKESGYITLIQTNLKNRGYFEGKVDGKFGDKTEQAVMEFQKDLGKPVSGSVGPKTWEQLGKSTVVKINAQPKQPPIEPIIKAGESQPANNQNCSVVIEGLTKYQADLLIKLFQGHTECRIL